MSSTEDWITVDGNEAVARVAYKLTELAAIYPITPSSSMGELADAWAAEGRTNLWGAVPTVVEMQSEAGAAGALHGAVQAGALATSFTASQGLLLMIPNMFKLAGQLLPCVLHVSARAVATHALSIFGDHSDVMAVRSTGWGLLCAGSVQEAQDFAAIAHAAALDSRVPFLHFFDGFRTSHEVAKIRPLPDDDLRALVDDRRIAEHRARALTPDHPVLRGSAQNPDVFFQSREAVNAHYLECPGRVQVLLNKLARATGRAYRLFDYEGAPDAERVIVVMGSAAETVAETVAALNARGERTGVVKVRLFRPFSTAQFVHALPRTVRYIAVLDRTKEPGSTGEPLYQDVLTAIGEAIDAREARFRFMPRVIGGRYGLGSKELTPAMVRAVFDELDEPSPRTHFTIGIDDDVTFASLAYDAIEAEAPDVVRALFYGLGSDGTVSANKNSIKIIGEQTDRFAQGYFVYDSKKSGATTISHLRFGPRPIRSTYLISEADFVACHQWQLLKRLDVLEHARAGATVLLNCPYPPAEAWREIPGRARRRLVAKRLRLFVIDAAKVAASAGMGRRVNTVLQACFFALSGILPRDRAIAAIKEAAKKTYGAKGQAVVEANFAAIDAALEALSEVPVPELDSTAADDAAAADEAPAFVREVTRPILEGRGDSLPVSRFPVDGTFPVGTSQWEKRNIAERIPVWHAATCIQCNKCVLVCPHAAIRVKTYSPALIERAPATFKSDDYRGAEFKGLKYTIQVGPEDCTGCDLCVEVCPAKDKSTGVKALEMKPQPPLRDAERENFAFFLALPDPDRGAASHASVKGSQFLQPLFEYSGACAGCGETPYLKLATQLFGDRMVVANATGCSSIFGGNLPTTPWTCNREGLGPAWANSLFEDNAEFGYGLRLAIDAQAGQARALAASLARMIDDGGDPIVGEILHAVQDDESGIFEQRRRVDVLKARVRRLLAGNHDDASAYAEPLSRLLDLADALVKKSVWIVGGDGWAYDIGYGGLDHVLASDKDVNVLVLDTEVYSNTGGQASKATPRGAVARFAASGKRTGKKDLGLLAMTYGHVYVARVALGANDTQTVKAFLEAEAYKGPSLVIAYAHCIAHGLEVREGLQHQQLAVASGHWPLYRFDPRAAGGGKFPLTLDSRPPKIPFTDYAYRETRYSMLTRIDRAAAERLAEEAQRDVTMRWRLYEQLAAMQIH